MLHVSHIISGILSLVLWVAIKSPTCVLLTKILWIAESVFFGIDTENYQLKYIFTCVSEILLVIVWNSIFLGNCRSFPNIIIFVISDSIVFSLVASIHILAVRSNRNVLESYKKRYEKRLLIGIGGNISVIIFTVVNILFLDIPEGNLLIVIASIFNIISNGASIFTTRTQQCYQPVSTFVKSPSDSPPPIFVITDDDDDICDL